LSALIGRGKADIGRRPNGDFGASATECIFLSRIIHFVAWRPPGNHFLKPASRPLLSQRINLARNRQNYFISTPFAAQRNRNEFKLDLIPDLGGARP
jgi:hypothetical protein